MRARIAMATFTLGLAASAIAEIPDDYRPVPVEAGFSFSERRFDLTPAIERARAEKKLLFVYLGAKNCPYCIEYERGLRKHREELLPLYGKHIVVDIRTWLSGPDITFQVGSRKYTFAEFSERVGNRGAKVIYPTYWLITPDLKSARKLPQGSAFYKDLESHKRLLAAAK